MESKKATKPIQSQLLLEMCVPADTADAHYDPGNNRLLFIPRDMRGSQFGYCVAWTVDALIDYLCDDIDVYIQFSKATWGFWVCCYTRRDGEAKVSVSKAGPTKIDAIFEVIYELHRNKYGTGIEKEN